MVRLVTAARRTSGPGTCPKRSAIAASNCSGVTPVPGSGNTQFTLTFADQDLRGTYRLTVGPDVRDSAGNWMNQDGDSIMLRGIFWRAGCV